MTAAGLRPRFGVGRWAGVASAIMLLAGCTPAPAVPQRTSPAVGIIRDQLWQVVGIYSSPDSPSLLPAALTQPPAFSLGTLGWVGTSGCSQFRATATYYRDANLQQQVAMEGASTLRINAVTWRDNDETIRHTCTGEKLWAHNQFSRLIAAGNSFDIRPLHADELVLTLRSTHPGQVDPPSLRLVSIPTDARH